MEPWMAHDLLADRRERPSEVRGGGDNPADGSLRWLDLGYAENLGLGVRCRWWRAGPLRFAGDPGAGHGQDRLVFGWDYRAWVGAP